MVPNTSSSTTVESPAPDQGFSTAINGLLGGVAGIVLSFVPLSTLLGGAVAGYLEGGEPNDGLKPGLIAGLAMLVPFVFIAFLLLGLLGFGNAPLGFGLLGVFILLFSALYTVGLSVIGGYIGVYIKNELQS